MKLINKDELIKAFDNECAGECGCCKHSTDIGKCNFIKDFPITVEVVRCKNCKYGIPSSKDYVFCSKATYFSKYKEPNWFCADGEARDEE